MHFWHKSEPPPTDPAREIFAKLAIALEELAEDAVKREAARSAPQTSREAAAAADGLDHEIHPPPWAE